MNLRSFTLFVVFVSVLFNKTFAQIGSKILNENNLNGLKDSLNYMGDFNNGYARIADKKGKLNFINKQGKKVYPKGQVTEFSQESGYFPYKYFVFKNEDGYSGLIDTAGNVLLPSVYRDIYFKNRYIIIRNDKYGILDEKLKTIVGFEYDYIDASSATDSLIIVTRYSKEARKNKLGVYNVLARKEIILPDFFENINNEKWAFTAYKDGYFALYNLSGHLIIPFNKYLRLRTETTSSFVHGINGDSHNVMDSTGKILIPGGIYDDIWAYDVKADLFLVKKNNLWGAINLKNNIVIPIEYNELEGFTGDGISRALKNGEWLFISKKGYKLGASKNIARKGYRRYVNQDTVGYVDSTGQIFPFPNYKTIDDYSKKGILVCTKSMKRGIMNDAFKLVADTVYTRIESAYNGYFIVQKDYKYGVLDGQGIIHIPVKYDAIRSGFQTSFDVVIGEKKETITLKKIE